VDVKLSPGGKVKVHHRDGTVNVITDIVGYHTNSSLVEIQNRLTALAPKDDALNARITDQRSTTQTPATATGCGSDSRRQLRARALRFLNLDLR
jgi:hypothetical protein